MWQKPTFEKLQKLAEAMAVVAAREVEKETKKLEAIKKLARLKHGLETADPKGTDTGR